jgi:hypothetical protein
MTFLYHVDAETRTPSGKGVSKDFHLETLDVAEAEHKFLECWFRSQFWNVRIWKELVKDEKTT